MTREERALIYFEDLRARKIKDYSSVLNTAPKDSVVYGAASAEIEIYDTVIEALEGQKTGKWIPHEYGGYYCSRCKSDSLDEVDGNYIHLPARTKYCHNCGLKMEVEDDYKNI